MEGDSILATAIFIIILAISLFGFFIYLIKAARKDSRTAMTRLHAVILKVREANNMKERTFERMLIDDASSD